MAGEGKHSSEVTFWADDRTFQENMAELLNLDPQYAPWNTERHSPAESWQQFGEGCAMPVTSFIDLPEKFSFEKESRVWWAIVSSPFESKKATD